jgi:hypothetical protein
MKVLIYKNGRPASARIEELDDLLNSTASVDIKMKKFFGDTTMRAAIEDPSPILKLTRDSIDILKSL